MKNINELKKGVKELVIALLKCKPTKDKEIIDFNVRAFMGGFEDYLSNQSVSDLDIETEIDNYLLKDGYHKKSLRNPLLGELRIIGKSMAKWMRDTPTPKKEEKDKRDLLIGLLNHLNKKYMIAMIPTKNEDLVDDYLSTPPIKEQGETKEIKFCINCGCGKPKKTYDGYWCKMCKTEL